MANEPIDFGNEELNQEYADILASIGGMLEAFNSSLEAKGYNENKRARAAGLIFSPIDDKDDAVTNLIGVPGAVTDGTGYSATTNPYFSWECSRDKPGHLCIYIGQEEIFCMEHEICKRRP